MVTDRRRSLAARRGWITRRRRQEIIRRADEKAAKVQVRPCVECRSRQQCASDCRLAPWNMEDDDA